MADERIIIDVVIKSAQDVTNLRKSIKDLRDERDKLAKSEGDNTEAINELNVAIATENEKLKQSNKTLNQSAKEYVSNANSIEQLRLKTNRLTAERDKLDRSTKEGKTRFKELTAEIKNNNAELGRLDTAIGKSGHNVGNYANGALKGLVGAFGVGLGAAGLAGAIKKSIDLTAKLDDAFANVMKTTGMTRDEVQDLYTQFRSFDTRTSIDGLLGIAEAAGRMNIAKADIVEFTRVVDKVFVALGDSLPGTAEEIATQLAKISTQFGFESEFGVAEGINKIGSAINDLGAKTKASEAPIIEFTNRLVGLASSLDLNVGDITALGALLDANGQSMEIAGTAISQVLIKMSQDTNTFAELAGMSITDFESLLREDAIKALMAVSSNLRETSRDPIALAQAFDKMNLEGQRTVATLGVLSQNTKEYAEFQKIANTAIEQGASLSNEFNIKNNTLAASIEKLNNNWQALLTAEGGGGFFKSVIDFSNDAILKFGNLDLIFTRDSKMTQEQWGRSVDTMLRLSTGMYKEFQVLYEGFNKMNMETLVASKETMMQQLDDIGFSTDDAESLYGEFLRRKSKQIYAQSESEKQAEKDKQQKIIDEQLKAEQIKKTNAENAIKDKKKTDDEATKEELRQIEIRKKENEDYFKNYIEWQQSLSEQRQKELNEWSARIKAVLDATEQMFAQATEMQLERVGDEDKLLEAQKEKEIQAVNESVATKSAKEALLHEIDLKYDNLNAEIVHARKEREYEAYADILGKAATLFKEHTAAYKILASAEALINTYLSATAAYRSVIGIPVVGAVLAPIAAGVAVASGLANVAKINNIKFAQGGILEGNSHAQGGIKMFGKGGYFGEAEGGEVILTKNVSKNPELLSAASNLNQMAGGRAFFAQGGIVTPPQLVSNNIRTTQVVAQPVLVVQDVTELQGVQSKVKAMAID